MFCDINIILDCNIELYVYLLHIKFERKHFPYKNFYKYHPAGVAQVE